MQNLYLKGSSSLLQDTHNLGIPSAMNLLKFTKVTFFYMWASMLW